MLPFQSTCFQSEISYWTIIALRVPHWDPRGTVVYSWKASVIAADLYPACMWTRSSTIWLIKIWFLTIRAQCHGCWSGRILKDNRWVSIKKRRCQADKFSTAVTHIYRWLVPLHPGDATSLLDEREEILETNLRIATHLSRHSPGHHVPKIYDKA